MTTYTTRRAGLFGVTFHYYSPTESIDHLGSVATWNARLMQIASGKPPALVKLLLEGLDVHIVDMDCDRLDAETARRQANLQEFDLSTPTPNAADGLYWNRDKLELAVWHPDQQWGVKPSRFPITTANVQRAQDAMSHEIGHHAARCMGFQDANAPFVGKELTRLLLPLLPKHISSPGEAVAEVWRAANGCERTRGYYSDHTPAPIAPDLRLLVTVGPLVYERLAQKIFQNLVVTPSRIYWDELAIVTRYRFTFGPLSYFPYTTTEVTGRYAIDLQGNLTRL